MNVTIDKPAPVGPGTYQIDKEKELKALSRYKFIRANKFASEERKTIGYVDKKVSSLPGPGAYPVPSDFGMN